MTLDLILGNARVTVAEDACRVGANGIASTLAELTTPNRRDDQVLLHPVR